MATNISIKQVVQVGLDAGTAKVRIDFLILGILPDLVEIYAASASNSLGQLIEQVEINSPENDYSSLIDLPAGSEFFLHLCPREKENGVLQDQIDDQPFETFCSVVAFTTTASVPGTPRPKPAAPNISGIEPHQATLHADAFIVIRWTAVTNFDQYHFMWREQPQGFTEIEIESAGTSGFFKLMPVTPGRTYSFKAQGCITHLIGLNDCSPFSNTSDFVMPPNTRSLGAFVRLSQAHLNPGVRSLGAAAISHGIRAMMRL